MYFQNHGISVLKKDSQESQKDRSRLAREITKVVDIMQNGQKKLANTIQMENARLNRSMTDNSWSERRDLIDQVRKTQDILVRGMSNNHDNLKLLFDNTVSKSLRIFR